jgi:hypothetical protein
VTQSRQFDESRATCFDFHLVSNVFQTYDLIQRLICFMFRCIHILACLTVLTTALPPGWCCWLMPSGCCAPGTDAAGLRDDASTDHAKLTSPIGFSACGAHCCQQQNATGKKAVAASQVASDVDTDATLISQTQPLIPAPRSSNRECCQRAPIVTVVSFDFLVNPLLALVTECETLLVQPCAAHLADVAIPASSDAIRLHARLGRWLI